MKNLTTITLHSSLLLLTFLASAAEIECDYESGEQSTVLMTPEVTAAAGALFGEDGAALLHAVKLQMDKYDRDVTTPEGRRSWHGKLIGQEVYTDEGFKIEVYSNELNGAIWRYKTPFRPPKALTPKPATLATNGVPARLAAARARRMAEQTPQTVNVEIFATNSIPPVSDPIPESLPEEDPEEGE